MAHEGQIETDLEVGPNAISNYSRLSYTMWHALAEFVDNSTQSRFNYSGIIEDVLKSESTPLTVKISYERLKADREIVIEDNSIGMNDKTLVAALKIAQPTKDSRGRSKYGMGLKTAACWIGARWQVVTCEWDSGKEWTADFDVEGVAHHGKKIILTPRTVDKSKHGTKVIIRDLHRHIQAKTEDNIRSYLGSMYRFDIEDGSLKLFFNNEEIHSPQALEFDVDHAGQPMKRQLPETIIHGKKVCGWVAVLRKGGRKFGGFSLFQERRQIQGFPTAWKPRSIFGGVDEEGANNLVAQRLCGLIELDGFKVSHTKDAILFDHDEEEQLEKLLVDATKDYRDYATKRRGTPGQPWAREKIKDLLEGMQKEFTSPEMQDAIKHSPLPGLDTITKNNENQVASLAPEDTVATWQPYPELRVIVALQARSEHDPYLTIQAAAEAGTIYVIINNLHPYYCDIQSSDAAEECLRQYIYDAIAEYRVSKSAMQVVPNSVRRMKSDLLRVQSIRIENVAAAERERAAPVVAPAAPPPASP